VVRLSSELLCAGERWLTDSVGVGLTASDAAVFEGLATLLRIGTGLLFSGATSSDGWATLSLTD
jgi:hypothetical protein